MKNRIYVKFRVDMYDDIKCKIIDTKARRDLIHYILARFIVLAGKVDLDGDLYVTENMPYTIQTLSIEFNRSYEEVEYAISILNELEIIHISEENTFKVKNWSKHQNNCKKKNIIKENNKKEEQLQNDILVEENENSFSKDEVKNSVKDKRRINNEKIYYEEKSKGIDNSNKVINNCNPKIKNTNGSNKKDKVHPPKYDEDIDEKADMISIKDLFEDEEVISIFAEDQDDFLKGEGGL